MIKRSLLSILSITVLLIFPGTAQHGPTALAAQPRSVRPAALIAAPRYTITDLGTLGGNLSKAFGINESNQVVGWSNPPSANYHAFLWEDGTISNLGDLGWPESFAYGINDAGQVVGGSPTPLGYNYTHAFRWENGVMQDLGTLGGTYSAAFEINSSGQAVGYAQDAEGVQHAALWGNSGIVDLGDLDPVWPTNSAAYGINDAGQVVGNSGTSNPAQLAHAFLWNNGSMQDLGTLGGDYSSATAINTDGHVVGTSKVSGGTSLHAFLWQSGAMQDLGALGWNSSYANDINDDGQVVGTLQTGQNYHAFIWANGQMQDLNDQIPTDSGWVLTEAQAINDKSQIVGFGTINGQTRAFLLKPNAYHWTNPSGGLWHLTTNWDPQGDPGAGDTVIFALHGQYSVDVGTLVPSPSSLAANQFSIDRMVVSSTNFVYFDNMDLNMVYDSPEEPSLEVNDGGTAAFNSGAATFSHAIIGRAPPANSSNPPIARLQVLGNGTSLSGTGRLTIGDEGAGDLFVTAGGHLTSAEARLGGLLLTGPGTADVGGDGSLWETGNIAVGYGVNGTLAIQYGGRVNSNDAYVSYGVQSEDSQVTVNSISAITGQPSLWALLGSLFVGHTDFGSVEVLDGGSLYVGQDVHITNGELQVDGRHPTGGPSEMDVLGTVFVGGPGSANLLALWNAARGGIEGNLIIGQHGEGAAILWGAANTAHPTQLDVVDPLAGLCAIGRQYDGGVSLDDGGLLRCQEIELGGPVGTSGFGTITVDGGMVRALDVLTVGQVGGGSGLVEMLNNALVATNGTYISANGVIAGSGKLAVGFLGLQNDGTLSPDITVMYPIVSPNMSQIQAATATMTITGDLTSGSSGRLVIPLNGGGAGQYGSLAVDGAAVLDGVLVLDFRNGYAPTQGDTFTFLTATGALTGSFDSVAITGLMPGFEYDLKIVNGQLVLEAINDGVPQRMVFLPLVRR